MTPITAWRIHVGAHKTATTHMQDSLEACAGALAAAGVDYISRDVIRATRMLQALHGGRYGWRHRLGWPQRRRIEAWAAPLRRGPAVIALSEENLLGNSLDLLDWPFYPRAVGRLRALDTLAGGGAALELFLSVRDFAGLLPSAYAQMLRVMPIAGGFDLIRDRALASPPSWLEFAQRLRGAAPRARLTIWTLEDYARDPRAVMARFCGVPLPPAEALPPPAQTRAPSAAAITAIERLDADLPPERRAKAVAAIIAADDGAERFAPFDAADRVKLRMAYEADLAQMAKMFAEAFPISSASV